MVWRPRGFGFGFTFRSKSTPGSNGVSVVDASFTDGEQFPGIATSFSKDLSLLDNPSRKGAVECNRPWGGRKSPPLGA
jgi:hypothetical protein